MPCSTYLEHLTHNTERFLKGGLRIRGDMWQVVCEKVSVRFPRAQVVIVWAAFSCATVHVDNRMCCWITPQEVVSAVRKKSWEVTATAAEEALADAVQHCASLNSNADAAKYLAMLEMNVGACVLNKSIHKQEPSQSLIELLCEFKDACARKPADVALKVAPQSAIPSAASAGEGPLAPHDETGKLSRLAMLEEHGVKPNVVVKRTSGDEAKVEYAVVVEVASASVSMRRISQ